MHGAAFAQPSYPTKPIRFISPFAPGGSTDVLARLLGQRLTESLGQTVVVENRPGAAGNIGAELVARAPADGYTMLLCASSLSINPSIQRKMPFDTRTDLAPITLVGTSPNALTIHPVLPARTVQELVALAKRRPNQLEYASGGIGTGGHMIGELFKHTAGVRFVHIPYKGSGPAALALLQGEAALAFNNIIAVASHLRTGRLRALAVTSAKRAPGFPDLPTIAESGYPGFEADSWYGVLTTGRAPVNVVATLNRELQRILANPDVVERLTSIGVLAAPTTPEAFARLIDDEMQKWRKVIELAGARND